MRRFWLTLSTYADIVFNAKHWFCRIRWIDEQGKMCEEAADALAVQALYATAGQPGSHRIVSALRAIEAWIREGGAL